MNDTLYSVRMRASRSGRHLSGAERIGRQGEVSSLSAMLTERAMNCAGGTPDVVCCTLERLAADTISTARFPEVRRWQVRDRHDGRTLAGRLLAEAGIPAPISQRCLQVLAEGASPEGGVMRGAMVVDAVTGQRLEPDPARGVRVSHMDVASEERCTLELLLKSCGLGHHRVLEALVLSAKVLKAPGFVAELCWSDDPDYVTGYVASPAGGYHRISHLKDLGDPRGGRIFLVDGKGWQQEAFVDFLEKQPMLIRGTPVIHPAESWSS